MSRYRCELILPVPANLCFFRPVNDYEKKITTKWIGWLIRKKLGLKTERNREGHLISLAEKDKLAHLYEKYGIGGDENEAPAVAT